MLLYKINLFKIIPKIIALLATGALTTVGDVAMKKIMGSEMINVPNDKKIDLLKTNALTKNQIKKIKNSKCDCNLKLTNKQLQNGGFLGLLASLGIPLITSLISGLTGRGLSGKGLQTGPPSRGKGLQLGRTRSIPFNTGEGLQIEPSSKIGDTVIVDLEPGKKPNGLKCNVYNGNGLQIRTRKRNRLIKCKHMYGSGAKADKQNCNSNCNPTL